MSGYLPLVYNIVGRALSGHAGVDDVVQETMLRAVRGLGDLRDPAGPGAHHRPRGGAGAARRAVRVQSGLSPLRPGWAVTPARRS
jgi:hypothetical protein